MDNSQKFIIDDVQNSRNALFPLNGKMVAGSARHSIYGYDHVLDDELREQIIIVHATE